MHSLLTFHSIIRALESKTFPEMFKADPTS